MIGLVLLSILLSLTGAALCIIGIFVRSRIGTNVCLSAAALCWLLALALTFLPA